jgi:hypothetical protein
MEGSVYHESVRLFPPDCAFRSHWDPSNLISDNRYRFTCGGSVFGSYHAAFVVFYQVLARRISFLRKQRVAVAQSTRPDWGGSSEVTLRRSVLISYASCMCGLSHLMAPLIEANLQIWEFRGAPNCPRDSRQQPGSPG